MAKRIEIFSKVFDARSVRFKFKNVNVIDVYTIDKQLSAQQLKRAGESLANPVTQNYRVSWLKPSDRFSWGIEIGFLPGVTDNVGNTAREIIEDLLKVKFLRGEAVYSSTLLLIKDRVNELEIKRFASNLINPLIQRVQIKSYKDFMRDKGMGVVVPQVVLNHSPKVVDVNLDIPDEELFEIGRKGIVDGDGSRRGPLALDPVYMKTIQNYFKKLGRNPTDIELETLAQTWSEHCKHTIFADPLDEIKSGLFKNYIKGATKKIRKKRGKKDFCVSVFTDNSGAIDFDQGYLITHKAETHNSPSALDPFGGAITGIVGVNRDALGFGLGAKPIINTYGFMFGDPDDKAPLYRGVNKTTPMLLTRRIMNGVIEGVNAGGNQSGIPTPQGFIYFDDRYKGKPLVFCGTIGLIKKRINGRAAYVKKAQAGDYIVMLGGRVGLDGIHGATFSSEALSSGSPATAVQIGDPITQKKLSDALVKEARDLNLYNSITDDGAGGLSSSVGEMAKESGGCRVDLDKVPLKYPGLDPWQIWISESQERMTLAVPKNKWGKFQRLMESRGVEATILGEFTNSKKCQVYFKGRTILDLDMEFLHDGLPKRQQRSTYLKPKNKEPQIPVRKDLSQDLLNMLSRKNIASFEFISNQYDHDVQGGSVLKPLVGKGRVNSEVTVMQPLSFSKKGLVLSQGYYPSYSDIDTYQMAAASVDTAIRNCIAVGANPDKIALLDNFCWCSSSEPQRLGELKRAVKACYDSALSYGTPFISGKDSMFNDFKGFDEKGKPIKISIPPTLLISAIGVIEDIKKAVSLDLKSPGDLIYVLGKTHDELGGSEYAIYLGGNDPKRIGNKVPQVKSKQYVALYNKLSFAINEQLISASIAITRGGLVVALAKMAMAGKLGIDVSLADNLFSESAGRFVITIRPENKSRLEKLMKGLPFKKVGRVSDDGVIRINKNIFVGLNEALKSYRKTFKDY